MLVYFICFFTDDKVDRWGIPLKKVEVGSANSNFSIEDVLTEEGLYTFTSAF